MSVIEWIADARSDWPGVVDQGPRPTCLSVAMTSVREQVTANALSAEFLHWASGKYPGGRGVPSAAVTALGTDGQPPDEQWPYDPAIDDTDPLYAPPASIGGPYVKGVLEDVLSGLDAIIGVLEQGAWAVVGLRVTDAFAATGTAVVLPDGPGRAGHAVVAVAAARVTTDQFTPVLAIGDRLLCVRNSWGQAWGSGGHKIITEAALQQCMITAFSLGSAAA